MSWTTLISPSIWKNKFTGYNIFSDTYIFKAWHISFDVLLAFMVAGKKKSVEILTWLPCAWVVAFSLFLLGFHLFLYFGILTITCHRIFLFLLCGFGVLYASWNSMSAFCTFGMFSGLIYLVGYLVHYIYLFFFYTTNSQGWPLGHIPEPIRIWCVCSSS